MHFLAAKRATQDEFLHTFNSLIDKGAPIVLAADQHPRLIARLPDELVTRFLAGMVVKIEPPDVATRCAILQSKATMRGVIIPEAVVSYIAEHLRLSVRELEGALHTVIAEAVLNGKRLDLNLAKHALRDTIRHTGQAVAIRDVERAVCQLFQVSTEAPKSDSRTRSVAYPRMLAMYLARKYIGAAYHEIGRYFGGRNHSTVISAEKKVESWLRAEESGRIFAWFRDRRRPSGRSGKDTGNLTHEPGPYRPYRHGDHIADIHGEAVHLAYGLHLALRVEEVDLHVPAVGIGAADHAAFHVDRVESIDSLMAGLVDGLNLQRVGRRIIDRATPRR